MITNLCIARRQRIPDYSGLSVAGVDEAGRGCLAGPVTAAAVVFDARADVGEYTDSKLLSPERREALAAKIRREALAWAVAHRGPREIDRDNVLVATLKAMSRAVAGLETAPELILIDGDRAPECRAPVWTVVGGDARIPLIGAASILAKCARDALMRRLHRRFPRYGFASHKGYGTALHKRMLAEHGPCDAHRMSFAPCRLPTSRAAV